jgi:carbon-monoxide dehydrogenase small subunit
VKGELKELTFTVNGKPCELKVKPETLLVDLLREELRLTGTKKGCQVSACGACTVNIDGKAVRSCSVLALQANGHEVTTIEGVADVGQGITGRESQTDTRGCKRGDTGQPVRRRGLRQIYRSHRNRG